MRNLKFRVWDTEQKKYVFPVIDITTNFSTNQLKSYVWQQHTGVKDLKNNDIFEGDIVAVFTNADIVDGKIVRIKNFNIYEVIFYNGMFCTSKTDDCPISSYREDIEIIGNINETPNLL